MRTTRNFILLVSATTGLVAVIGCNRDHTDRGGERTGATRTDERTGRETTGTTTITGASLASATAIDRLVAARCEREERCKNVGADKKYTNPSACGQKLRNDMKDDLNAKDCPRGVDQKELNECLEQIRKEDCGSPIDAISRLTECRSGELCREH